MIEPKDYEIPKAERRPDPGVQFAGLVFISIFMILIGIFIGLWIAY